MNETTEVTEASNALICVEQINALEVFTEKGVEPILEEIKNKVALLVPDVETSKGRKEIASMANKIARSKTLLDEVGKNLVADWKAKAKVVDDSRKKMRDTLDQLKEITRAPLTEWEQAERDRIEKYEVGLKELIALQTIEHGATVEQIQGVIGKLDSFSIGDDWVDLKERATAAHTYALQNAHSRLEQRKEYDEQQIEIQRLREQEAKRLAEQAEQQARAKAAEEAKVQAEQNARRAIERAEAEKHAAIEAQKRAEERARMAEQNAKAEAEAAIKREAEQKAFAEREAKQRAEAQLKYEAQKKAEQAAEKKRREELKKNLDRRIAEAAEAIGRFMVENDSGQQGFKDFVEAIIAGDIPHLKFES